MADGNVLLSMRLRGQQAVAAGLTGTARDMTRVGASARTAQTRAQRMGREIEQGADRGSRSMRNLRRAVGAAAGAFAGLEVINFLRDSVKASADADASQARLTAQLRASGVSYQAHAKQIDKVIQATSKLAALDDEDLQDAFTNIVRVTGNVSQSLRLTGLAADVARAKHLDVAKAGEIVGKVAGGNTGVLSRYGVQLKKGATTAQALAAMQRKFGGQADAYGKTAAGANDRVGVSMENLQERIGKVFSPQIAKAADAISTFIDGIDNGTGAGGRFAATISRIAKVVGGTVGTVSSLYRQFKDGNPAVVAAVATISGLAAAFATYKLATTAARTATIGLNIAMAANPAVALAAAVVGVGVAFTIAYRKIKPFRDAVDGTIRFVRSHWKLLGGAITGPIGLAVGVVSSRLNTIKGVARGVKDAVLGTFRAMRDTAKSIFATVGRAIGAVLKAPINAVIGALNKIHIHIPKVSIPLAPDFPGVDIGLNIPKLASGGTVRRGGMALVGERGPELVNLPGGSTVYSNRVSSDGMGALMARLDRLTAALEESGLHVSLSGREVGRALGYDKFTRGAINA